MSEVTFQWCLQWREGRECDIVKVLIFHAMKRGVPLPSGWSTYFRCMGLAERLDMFATKVQLPADMTEVRCRLLGRPISIQDPADELAPGTCLTLLHRGGQKNFVLVSLVKDNQWLCHAGGFDGELAIADSFRESDLILKDLRMDICNATHVPLRRVSCHAKLIQLKRQIRERAMEFDELVAAGVWIAEELRCGSNVEAMDFDRATARYERNPFRWIDFPDFVSWAQVCIVWSGRSCGKPWYHRCSVYLCNLFHATRNENVPLPPALTFDSETLLRHLKEREAYEVRLHGCPCEFLGEWDGNIYIKSILYFGRLLANLMPEFGFVF